VVLNLDAGAEAMRADPTGFARIQWDTWSPPGWFDDTEFTMTAKSFSHPDWASITLNAYRQRWQPEASDSRYDALQTRLYAIETISTPTLMIQGGMDTCDEPSSSEGLDGYFTGGYRRLVLDRSVTSLRARRPTRLPMRSSNTFKAFDPMLRGTVATDQDERLTTKPIFMDSAQAFPPAGCLTRACRPTRASQLSLLQRGG